MKKIGLLFVVCLIALVACTSKDTAKKEGKKSGPKNVCDIDCEPADMSGYKGFEDENHVFLSVNFKEANKMIKDTSFSGVIYFGFATCPWCIEAVPIMNEVAKDRDLNIYYVDKNAKINKDNPTWLEETTSILDEAYGLDMDEETGKPRLYVPEVIVVKNGKIVDHHMGTLEDHDATERKMNKDEKRVLEKIYEKMFDKIS